MSCRPCSSRWNARETRERVEDFDLDVAREAAAREPRTKPGDLWLQREA